MKKTLDQIHQEIREKLVFGTLTNFGVFTHFDKDGTANFIQSNGEKGWTGSLAFHFIEIR